MNNVKNAGKVKGKEVVQMYVKDHFGSVTRPVRELKGFELIDEMKCTASERSKEETCFECKAFVNLCPVWIMYDHEP